MGKMPVRSQYALLLLCVVIVILMGLMGFIRSRLRMDWHIYGICKILHNGRTRHLLAYMGRIVGLIVALFLGLVAFVFWLAGLGDKKEKAKEHEYGEVSAGYED